MKHAVIVVLFTTYLASAQPNLAFEAASVKPAGPPVSNQVMGFMRGGPGTTDPGRITIYRANLAQLLTRAYGVESDQVSGPAWIEDRDEFVYRVDATMPPNTSKEQFQLMFQNLLAERFHLRLHHENKTRQGYELVVAAGGPKLTEWTPDTNAAAVDGKSGVDERGFLKLGSGRGPGFVMPRGGGFGPIRVTSRQTMTEFCRGLGSDINMSRGLPIKGVQPRIVDKTGLTATYEFRLEFAGSFTPMESAPAAASDPAGAPDIFTAVEKQLGLKLVKVPDIAVDTLIVDSADKVPTQN